MTDSAYAKRLREPIFKAVEKVQACKNTLERGAACKELHSLLTQATANALEYKELRDGIIDTLDRSGNHSGAALVRTMTGLPSKEVKNKPRSSPI